MLRDRRTILGLLGAALLGVAAVPFLLRADDPELAVRRRRIEGMPQAERERIQRNFKQFQTMSEADRRHLRAFDAALEADRINNRGGLSETLRTYADWLKTVTPHQRDALQQESDPAKRIKLIREVVESQRDERIETRMGGRIEQFLGPIPNLSRQDLSAMLAIIDRKKALLVPSASSLQDLDNYEGISRSLKLIELMARSNRSLGDLLNETNSRQLLDAVTDKETRRELETIPDSERRMLTAVARRVKLGLTIQKAIFAELDRERRQRAFTPENLEKFFEKLPLEQQDELLELSPEQFRQELRDRYQDDQQAARSENPINFILIRQFFSFQRPGERSPPLGRRREGRPTPPDRRPQDRR